MVLYFFSKKEHGTFNKHFLGRHGVSYVFFTPHEVNQIKAFRGTYMPERPFYFPARKTWKIKEFTTDLLSVMRLEGGEAMSKTHT